MENTQELHFGDENGPARRMVATHCACCSDGLVDALSVETGVGPVCRKKHGYGTAQGPANWTAAREALGPLFEQLPAEVQASWGNEGVDPQRRAANCITHWIAVEQEGQPIAALAEAVRWLGFHKLAARIVKRVATVRIEIEEKDGQSILLVHTPYDYDAVYSWRRVAGRRWDATRKVNTFPVSSKGEVWELLKRLYSGRIGAGPSGAFVIGA